MSIPPCPTSIRVKNQLDELDRIVQWIEECSESFGWSLPFTMQINLFIEEWVVNIISYAYEDELEHEIIINVSQTEDLVSLKFIDDGKAFDPTQKADPNLELPIEERELGGLGIFFIKENSKEFRYSRIDNKNIVEIIKSTIESK